MNALYEKNSVNLMQIPTHDSLKTEMTYAVIFANAINADIIPDIIAEVSTVDGETIEINLTDKDATLIQSVHNWIQAQGRENKIIQSGFKQPSNLN